MHKSFFSMRNLFSVAIVLCFFFAALYLPPIGSSPSLVLAGTVPPRPTTPTPTPVSTPSWPIDSQQTNIGLFVVDYASAEVKQVYFQQEAPCSEPLPIQTIITNARSAISNTLTGQHLEVTVQAGGMLAESLEPADDFLAWSVHLGDFTGSALLHPCTGHPLFAGESIWAGHGVRTYPREPLPAESLQTLSNLIPPPPSLATVAHSDFMTMTAETAWAGIANLNLLHDLAQQPFKTVAFLYRPAIGYVDPTEELAQAEWIFIVYTDPSPRSQSTIEQYLPLIRQ
jgi:hypothetical protein